MLTGHQIREARRLLKWRREGLVTRARLPSSVIDRAEASDADAKITVAHEAAIRRAFEVVGVKFGVGDDGSPNARLCRGQGTMIPTGLQIREARALTGMSQADLAAAADVALGLIVRAEATDGMPMITKRDSAAIHYVLETAGVEFISEGGADAGVRLRKVEP